MQKGTVNLRATVKKRSESATASLLRIEVEECGRESGPSQSLGRRGKRTAFDRC